MFSVLSRKKNDSSLSKGVKVFLFLNLHYQKERLKGFSAFERKLIRDNEATQLEEIKARGMVVKNVSKQIMKNPNISICALSDGKWVRIEALAIEDDRDVARQAMLDAHPQLKAMYSADDGNTQVLYLKNATATFYSFGSEPKVIKF